MPHVVPGLLPLRYFYERSRTNQGFKRSGIECEKLFDLCFDVLVATRSAHSEKAVALLGQVFEVEL
jgi:hypothetical protein